MSSRKENKQPGTRRSKPANSKKEGGVPHSIQSLAANSEENIAVKRSRSDIGSDPVYSMGQQKDKAPMLVEHSSPPLVSVEQSGHTEAAAMELGNQPS